MTLRKTLRAMILVMILAAFVYTVLVVVSDWRAVTKALASYRLTTVLAVIAMVVVGFFLRSVRWRLLMRLVGYPVSIRDAWYLQTSGYSMGVTPGRVGEALKPWLARELAGMPMGRGLALVVSERVADLLAVCLLSLGGLSVLGAGRWWLAAGLALLVIGTRVLSSRWFLDLASKLACRTSWARKHEEAISSIAETVHSALRWRVLVWSSGLAFVAWGLEGAAFVLFVRELGFDAVSALVLISIYAISAIIGAATMLPGGIGLTEASMVGILVALGMSTAGASAATLIVRTSTLWLGIALGWVVLASRPGVLRRVFASKIE